LGAAFSSPRSNGFENRSLIPRLGHRVGPPGVVSDWRFPKMSHNASNAANGISPGISPFTDEEEQFRRTVRTFLDREREPHYQEFEAKGGVSREFWRKAGLAAMALT
jgi:hypothetical protein